VILSPIQIINQNQAMYNTSEQLIQSYSNQWKQLIQASVVTEKNTLEKNIKIAYELMGYASPKCIFTNDIKVAINDILNARAHYLVQPDIKYRLAQEIWGNTKVQINFEMQRYIVQSNRDLYQFALDYKYQVFSSNFRQIVPYLTNSQNNLFTRLRTNVALEKWITYGSQSDFCISELNCEVDAKKWKVFQLLANQCKFIFCLTSFKNINIKDTGQEIAIAVGWAPPTTQT
jgi:hypothetical protein